MNPVDPQPARSGEPRLASIASWAVLVASFGLSASTWIALAVVAGFTGHLTVLNVTVFRLAWLMPVAVDGYVVVALVLWMSDVPPRVAEFAKRNTYGAAGIGIAAQSAYHLLFTLSLTHQGWRVVLAAIVGAIPPAVAGLAVHMRSLIRRESGKDRDTRTDPTPGTLPAPSASAQPTLSLSTLDTAVPTPVGATVPPDKSPASPVAQPTDPAPVPALVVTDVPTPADVATRINPPATATGPQTGTPTRPAARTRPTRPAPAGRPATQLAPPTADHTVTESGAAQLSLPILPEGLLNRAKQAAAQYRTEHGTPITAGQLAARLRINSDQAAQALALLNLDPDSPTHPVPTVNGNRPRGTTR